MVAAVTPAAPPLTPLQAAPSSGWPDADVMELCNMLGSGDQQQICCMLPDVQWEAPSKGDRLGNASNNDIKVDEQVNALHSSSTNSSRETPPSCAQPPAAEEGSLTKNSTPCPATAPAAADIEAVLDAAAALVASGFEAQQAVALPKLQNSPGVMNPDSTACIIPAASPQQASGTGQQLSAPAANHMQSSSAADAPVSMLLHPASNINPSLLCSTQQHPAAALPDPGPLLTARCSSLPPLRLPSILPTELLNRSNSAMPAIVHPSISHSLLAGNQHQQQQGQAGLVASAAAKAGGSCNLHAPAAGMMGAAQNTPCWGPDVAAGGGEEQSNAAGASAGCISVAASVAAAAVPGDAPCKADATAAVMPVANINININGSSIKSCFALKLPAVAGCGDAAQARSLVTLSAPAALGEPVVTAATAAAVGNAAETATAAALAAAPPAAAGPLLPNSSRGAAGDSMPAPHAVKQCKRKAAAETDDFDDQDNDDGHLADDQLDAQAPQENIQRLPKQVRELRSFKLQLSSLLDSHNDLTTRLVELSAMRCELFAYLTELRTNWQLMQTVNERLRSNNEEMQRTLQGRLEQQQHQA